MAMSLRYVKEIHSRLAVRYGSGWKSKWAEVPIELLEADWAEQLDGMQPDSIKKALENLPTDFPPTAPAFRTLGAIRHEAEPFKAIDYAPDPAIAKAALEAMNVYGKPTPREWMAQLDRDVKAGTASPARKRHHKIAAENGYYA
jgi:hypothetical protein